MPRLKHLTWIKRSLYSLVLLFILLFIYFVSYYNSKYFWMKYKAYHNTSLELHQWSPPLSTHTPPHAQITLFCSGTILSSVSLCGMWSFFNKSKSRKKSNQLSLLVKPEPKPWSRLGQRGPQGHFPEIDQVWISGWPRPVRHQSSNKEPTNVLRSNPWFSGGRR